MAGAPRLEVRQRRIASLTLNHVPIVVRIDTKCDVVDVEQPVESGVGNPERQDGYVVNSGDARSGYGKMRPCHWTKETRR